MKLANKVNNRDTRITSEICSKLTIKLSEQWFWAFICFLCVAFFIFQSFLDLIFSSWYLIFDSFILFKKDFYKVECTRGRIKTLEWKMHLSMQMSMVILNHEVTTLIIIELCSLKGAIAHFYPYPPAPLYSLMILVQNFMLIKKLGSENQQKWSYSPLKFCNSSAQPSTFDSKL